MHLQTNSKIFKTVLQLTTQNYIIQKKGCASANGSYKSTFMGRGLATIRTTFIVIFIIIIIFAKVTPTRWSVPSFYYVPKKYIVFCLSVFDG